MAIWYHTFNDVFWIGLAGLLIGAAVKIFTHPPDTTTGVPSRTPSINGDFSPPRGISGVSL